VVKLFSKIVFLKNEENIIIYTSRLYYTLRAYLPLRINNLEYLVSMSEYLVLRMINNFVKYLYSRYIKILQRKTAKCTNKKHNSFKAKILNIPTIIIWYYELRNII